MTIKAQQAPRPDTGSRTLPSGARLPAIRALTVNSSSPCAPPVSTVGRSARPGRLLKRMSATFASSIQAAQAGYRPCLRCRPESAPDSPAWQGTSTTVKRALRLIQQGALNTGSVAALAERLGVGERYLRKLFQRDLGVRPPQSAHSTSGYCSPRSCWPKPCCP